MLLSKGRAVGISDDSSVWLRDASWDDSDDGASTQSVPRKADKSEEDSLLGYDSVISDVLDL